MDDICSCRHNYKPGTLRLVSSEGLGAKIRGYYGSGVVNFFIKFSSEDDKNEALEKLQ